jgi:hypothetical protein
MLLSSGYSPSLLAAPSPRLRPKERSMKRNVLLEFHFHMNFSLVFAFLNSLVVENSIAAFLFGQ